MENYFFVPLFVCARTHAHTLFFGNAETDTDDLKDTKKAKHHRCVVYRNVKLSRSSYQQGTEMITLCLPWQSQSRSRCYPALKGKNKKGKEGATFHHLPSASQWR